MTHVIQLVQFRFLKVGYSILSVYILILHYIVCNTYFLTIINIVLFSSNKIQKSNPDLLLHDSFAELGEILLPDPHLVQVV